MVLTDMTSPRAVAAATRRLVLAASALLCGGCAEPLVGEEIDLSTADLTVFSDPDSDFTTTELLDADGQVLSFTTDSRIVWVETSTAWTASRRGEWTTDGNVLRSDGYFTVAYGSLDGTFAGWITRTSTGTVCDFESDGEVLDINPTNQPIEQD